MFSRFQANCLIAFGCVTATTIVSWAVVTHRWSPHGDGFEFIMAAAAIAFVSCLVGLQSLHRSVSEMTKVAEFFQILIVAAAVTGVFLGGAFLMIFVVTFLTTR